MLWALAGLCGVQRVPFDARSVLQQFPPVKSYKHLIHLISAGWVRVLPILLPIFGLALLT